MTNPEQRHLGRVAALEDLRSKTARQIADIVRQIENQVTPYVDGYLSIVNTRVTCADCGKSHNPHVYPSHECPEQRKANRAVQRKR